MVSVVCSINLQVFKSEQVTMFDPLEKEIAQKRAAFVDAVGEIQSRIRQTRSIVDDILSALRRVQNEHNVLFSPDEYPEHVIDRIRGELRLLSQNLSNSGLYNGDISPITLALNELVNAVADLEKSKTATGIPA